MFAKRASFNVETLISVLRTSMCVTTTQIAIMGKMSQSLVVSSFSLLSVAMVAKVGDTRMLSRVEFGRVLVQLTRIRRALFQKIKILRKMTPDYRFKKSCSIFFLFCTEK